jgi:hypothetical protein
MRSSFAASPGFVGPRWSTSSSIRLWSSSTSNRLSLSMHSCTVQSDIGLPDGVGSPASKALCRKTGFPGNPCYLHIQSAVDRLHLFSVARASDVWEARPCRSWLGRDGHPAQIREREEACRLAGDRGPSRPRQPQGRKVNDGPATDHRRAQRPGVWGRARRWACGDGS